jgi:hypothetical protein
VPGGAASSRPGRCQRPERCGAPGAVLHGRVLAPCAASDGHGAPWDSGISHCWIVALARGPVKSGGIEGQACSGAPWLAGEGEVLRRFSATVPRLNGVATAALADGPSPSCGLGQRPADLVVLVANEADPGWRENACAWCDVSFSGSSRCPAKRQACIGTRAC